MTLSPFDLNCFHDAELVDISRSPASMDLRLDFLAEDGRRLRARAIGVSMFRAVDIGMQNVVSRIASTHHRNIGDRNEVAGTLKWLSETVDGSSYLSTETLTNLLGKIATGELSLMVVDPSVGGEIAVLAAEITYEAVASPRVPAKHSQASMPTAIPVGARSESA